MKFSMPKSIEVAIYIPDKIRKNPRNICNIAILCRNASIRYRESFLQGLLTKGRRGNENDVQREIYSRNLLWIPFFACLFIFPVFFWGFGLACLVNNGFGTKPYIVVLDDLVYLSSSCHWFFNFVASIIFSRRLTFLFLLDSPTFSSHKSHTTKNIIKEFTSLSILIEIEHVAVIFFYKYLYYFHKIHFE